MKKMELKKQTNEQLKQLILQNQKDIVAEKSQFLPNKQLKTTLLRTRKKKLL